MTIEAGEGWAKIVFAIFQGLGLLYVAWAANRARINSGDVKQAIGAPSKPNPSTPTLQQQVREIHEKTDTAIQQNEQIVAQADQISVNTNGNVSKLHGLIQELLKELQTKDAEASRKDAVVSTLREQVDKLLAATTPSTTVVLPPAAAEDPAPRQARQENVPGRRAADQKPSEKTS